MFIIAEIQHLLLGVSFLNSLGLLINYQQRMIINPTLCSQKLKTFNDFINLVMNNNNMPDFIKGFIKSPYAGIDPITNTGIHAATFAKARHPISRENPGIKVEIFETAK